MFLACFLLLGVVFVWRRDCYVYAGVVCLGVVMGSGVVRLRDIAKGGRRVERGGNVKMWGNGMVREGG